MGGLDLPRCAEPKPEAARRTVGIVVRVIGRYPTPVQRLDDLSTSSSELWVKRDDLTSDVYGGNKVRKLERILEAARAKGARRIVTFGTAGSHQALAMTVHGRRAGFE